MQRYGLLCLVIAAGLAFTLVRQVIGHSGYLVDLRAFYCGGWSVLHHTDPYTSVARTCVDSIEPGAEVLRAPHPPFALAAYALLALFPFKAVGIAYIVLAWLAIAAMAIVISKLTAIDSWIVALGVAPLLGYFCTSFGQPQPFVALCIVLAAYFLVAQKFVAASICAALTLVFPQFGLPIVATIFVCVPQTRAALASAVAALGLIGLLSLGFAANVNYVTVSLKLEQLQTAGDSLQYGLPWLLQQAGVPSAPAAFAGSLWYVAVIVAGIVFLRRSGTTAPISLAALLPAALVPLSSTFVHPQHFALALPFAFFALSTRRQAVPVILGTALLIVPWLYCIVATATSHDVPRTAILLELGLAFVAVLVKWQKRRRIPILMAALGLYVLVTLIIHGCLGWIPSVNTPPNSLATLSFKLPTVAGLLVILGYGLAVPSRARRPD